jgi:alkylation response protein AidB-like acyl-CoA dehydrogenase
MILELGERLAGGLQRIVAAAATTVTDRGKPALEDDHVLQAIGRAATELEALRLMCQEMLLDLNETHRVTARSSLIKVYYSELLERITSLAVDLDGLSGQLARGLLMAGGWETGYWIADHLHSRRWMIGGGSNEIQRNVIATRLLNLPRETAAR